MDILGTLGAGARRQLQLIGQQDAANRALSIQMMLNGFLPAQPGGGQAPAPRGRSAPAMRGPSSKGAAPVAPPSSIPAQVNSGESLVGALAMGGQVPLSALQPAGSELPMPPFRAPAAAAPPAPAAAGAAVPAPASLPLADALKLSGETVDPGSRPTSLPPEPSITEAVLGRNVAEDDAWFEREAAAAATARTAKEDDDRRSRMAAYQSLQQNTYDDVMTQTANGPKLNPLSDLVQKAARAVASDRNVSPEFAINKLSDQVIARINKLSGISDGAAQYEEDTRVMRGDLQAVAGGK